tara:strand:- start:11106 stop:11810 length:705 start_codon:yes stop_codon:yes gene_type:complete
MSDRLQPFVSILMSTYNNEKTILKAVDSILLQDYINFELLILNDGSTDRTKSLLEQFKEKDKRIRIFSNEKNLGLTVSLNKLINFSKGEIILRQDADDFSVKNRISVQVHYLVNGKADICFSRAKVIDRSKIIPNLSYYLPYKLVMKYKNPFIHGTLAINRKVLQSIGNYDENFYFAQDYKLYKDVISKKFNIKKIHTVLYHLNTENNISSNYSKEQNYYAECVRKNIKPNQKE